MLKDIILIIDQYTLYDYSICINNINGVLGQKEIYGNDIFGYGPDTITQCLDINMCMMIRCKSSFSTNTKIHQLIYEI